MSKEEKPKKMAFSLARDTVQDFLDEAVQDLSTLTEVLRDYLDRPNPEVNKHVLSNVCQLCTIAYQMKTICDEIFEHPIPMKNDKLKLMISEEEMYLIETLALSKIYCESQLKRASISLKMN
jgi:hypothetical protein